LEVWRGNSGGAEEEKSKKSHRPTGGCAISGATRQRVKRAL